MADSYTTIEFQTRKTANKMTAPEKNTLQVFAANQNAHINVLHVIQRGRDYETTYTVLYGKQNTRHGTILQFTNPVATAQHAKHADLQATADNRRATNTDFRCVTAPYKLQQLHVHAKQTASWTEAM